MVEAMLWTMAEPLLAAQRDEQAGPAENGFYCNVLNGSYRCHGDDAWISLAVADDAEWRRLCATVPRLGGMAGIASRGRIEAEAVIDEAIEAWASGQDANVAAAKLVQAGIPAAALAGSAELAADTHLRKRGFWHPHGSGVLPGLPWNASFGQPGGAAPGLGADTDTVLRAILGLSGEEIDRLRKRGAFG